MIVEGRPGCKCGTQVILISYSAELSSSKNRYIGKHRMNKVDVCFTDNCLSDAWVSMT